MHSIQRLVRASAIGLVIVSCTSVANEQATFPDLKNPIQGPSEMQVNGQAKLQLPDGVMGLHETDSNAVLEFTGNLPRPGANMLTARRTGLPYSISMSPVISRMTSRLMRTRS